MRGNCFAPFASLHHHWQVELILYVVIVCYSNESLLFYITTRSNSRPSVEQEANGPHRSPEKTVQIIKQIWFNNVDSENKEKTFWEFIGSSTWIPFTEGCFVPRLVEICPVVLEEKILKFRKCVFSLFHNYLPLEKGGALHLNKPQSPSPKDALCQVWLKLAQWFW